MRNLSAILHPCVRVATMVVSEIKDKLSPNIAPPTTTAAIRDRGSPVWADRPAATGVRATIVPTEVPTETEITQAARKIPAASTLPGKMESVKLTVASTAPIALAVCANAPAKIKIITISIMLALAAPLQNSSMRLCNVPPLLIQTATIEDNTNATVIGIL